MSTTKNAGVQTRPRRIGRPGAWAVVGIALGLISACSATSANHSIGNSGGSSNVAAGNNTNTTGPGATGAGAAGGSKGVAAGSGAVGSGQGGGATGIGGTVAGGGGSSSPGGGGGGSGGALGSTTSSCKGSVKVGFSYPTDIGAAAAAVGISNPGQAAQAPSGAAYKNAIQNVVNYYNSHGGLNGCSIQGVYFPFTIATGDYTTESQQECALDTQDNHVVAAIPLGWEEDNFRSCMGQAHVPLIWAANIEASFMDYQMANQYPGTVWMPWTIAADRMGPFINYFDQAGYFNPGTKLGVVLNQGGTTTIYNDFWKPALAALHIDVASVFTYAPEPTSGNSESSGAESLASQSRSAELQFRTYGVNHVLFAPGAGSNAFGFVPVAKSQGYYPRYGLVSSDFPALASTVGGSAMAGAVAIGWIEYYDGVPGNQIVENSARALCDQLFKGQVQLANGGSYLLCDGMSLLQQGFRGEPNFSVASLQTGVGKLGTSFISSATFGPVSLSSQRFDGDFTVRINEYNSSAGTWNYVGPYITLP